MPLTITITGSLASELQSEAERRKISVEQFAIDVLGQAVQRDEWPAVNRHRLTLIRKQFADGLSLEEAAQLQELQRKADQHLESLDSRMLDDVAVMEKAAAGAIDGSTD